MSTAAATSPITTASPARPATTDGGVTRAGEGDSTNPTAAIGGTDEVGTLDQREDYEKRPHERSASNLGRSTMALPTV